MISLGTRVIFALIWAFAVITITIADGACPPIIGRAEWSARPPRGTTAMSIPVPFTIIHHSVMSACNETCTPSVKEIQDFHMDTNGWDDIGYSFLIGGYGQIYEGRGWQRVGAHSPSYNDRSIGICLIGDFTTFLPLEIQLNATRSLIQCGIDSRYIVTNYTLYGHRDVRATECPGQILYDEIEAWPHKGVPPTKG